jgi:hypothetical protein
VPGILKGMETLLHEGGVVPPVTGQSHSPYVAEYSNELRKLVYGNGKTISMHLFFSICIQIPF